MEGMVAWARRHFPRLPRERTWMLCVDTVGSPQLLLLEGEGMLGIREYPKPFLALIRECAAELGIFVHGDLRFRNATDGLIALKAGYRSAGLGSVTKYKFPSNYHSRRDVPERVDYGTVRDAATLCAALIRDAAK